MRIIPAIDIIDGKCVRLTQGDYRQKTIYNEDPLEVAKQFEGVGLKHLHLVDLDGAKAKHIINAKVLDKLSSQTSLQIDFGGGIKSDNDIRIAFECGARQVTGGSIAAQNRELFLSWIELYGTRKIILGADAKDGKIAVAGWQEATQLEVVDFISEYQNHGVEHVICTDIAKDGMLLGPSFDLYKSILEKCPDIKLIASGGVSTIEDIKKLEQLGMEGCIIGKAIYESKINLKELELFEKQNG